MLVITVNLLLSGLRFMLVLDEQAPKWVQTLEWDPNTTSDNKDTPTVRDSQYMINPTFCNCFGLVAALLGMH